VRRTAACAFCVVLAATAAPAGEPLEGVGALMAKATPVAVDIRPVSIEGEIGPGLKLRAAWELSSGDAYFGGFSGLLLDGGILYALSDRGSLLVAGYSADEAGLRLADARLAKLRDGSRVGPRRTKDLDTEGLSRESARLAISFERRPRVMFLGPDGQMHGAIQPDAFRRFASNAGPEGLATLPDGRLMVLVETSDDGGAPVFLLGPGDRVEEGRLSLSGPELPTGADIGPDGRLYLVRRSFSPLTGISIRVMRFALGADGFPLPRSGETLATFLSSGGIDNMEGLALDRALDGTLRLWLISDDNFSWLQRTLLMVFDVTG